MLDSEIYLKYDTKAEGKTLPGEADHLSDSFGTVGFLLNGFLVNWKVTRTKEGGMISLFLFCRVIESRTFVVGAVNHF